LPIATPDLTTYSHYAETRFISKATTEIIAPADSIYSIIAIEFY